MRIGRGIAVLAVIVAVPTVAVAQTGGSSQVWGVLGGLNISSVGGSDAQNTSSKVGFTLGAFMRWPIDDMWSLHTELDYVRKGTKFNDNGAQGEVAIGYVEVPVLFRGTTGDKDFRMYGEAGPAFSFKATCSVSLKVNGVAQAATCDDAGPFKSFDAGLAVGAGFEIPMGDYGFTAGVRYNYGFLKVLDQSGGGNDVKSRNLQFLAGVRF